MRYILSRELTSKALSNKKRQNLKTIKGLLVTKKISPKQL